MMMMMMMMMMNNPALTSKSTHCVPQQLYVKPYIYGSWTQEATMHGVSRDGSRVCLEPVAAHKTGVDALLNSPGPTALWFCMQQALKMEYVAVRHTQSIHVTHITV
jgi:hypothetical protein